MKLINGIIIAAGESRRTGTIKALLPYKDRNIILSQIDKMAGVINGRIFIVLGAHIEAIKNTVSSIYFSKISSPIPLFPKEKAANTKIEFVINHDWEQGQISSILTGIDASGDDSLFIPVDVPLVDIATYKAVMEKGGGKEKLIIPSYNLKRGHPIYIPYSIYPIIKELCQEKGLRELYRLRPDLIDYVNVQDDKILVDIDTMDDYNTWIRNN